MRGWMGGVLAGALVMSSGAQAQVVPASEPSDAPVVVSVVIVGASVPENAPVPVEAPPAPLTVALLLPPAQAAPVPAASGDWSREERSAARIRALQTWLMVGALRCRAGGTDLLADYSGFVSAARATLVAANDRVRARFVATYGAAEGQARFDRFTTSLANGYGGGGAAPDVCRTLTMAARLAAAEGGSPEHLLLIADLENVGDGLPGLDAPVEIAAR